jgi:hypothetical protein
VYQDHNNYKCILYLDFKIIEIGVSNICIYIVYTPTITTTAAPAADVGIHCDRSECHKIADIDLHIYRMTHTHTHTRARTHTHTGVMI